LRRALHDQGVAVREAFRFSHLAQTNKQTKTRHNNPSNPHQP
jgi:hypothetical protein